MSDFNFNEYLKNNPLLKETNGLGNYVQPEKMFGSPELDYQSAEDFDLDPQDGENDPLGPDEELMEGNDEVTTVFNEMLKRMRELIKSEKLSDRDVVNLKVKLAEFFKQ
tara:strand:- start:31 stop:357 length:327 start_codon:yes stop_codon:yes gene_type:complete